MARNSVETVSVAAFKTVRQLAGKRVTYQRGSDSFSVIAVPESSTLALPVNEASYEEVKVRAFMFLADELKINGAEILPDRRDVITEAGISYELLSIGDGAYEVQGIGHDIIKVFAKEIF